MATTDEHPIVIRARLEAQEMWRRVEQYGRQYDIDHMLPRFDWQKWKRTPPGQPAAGEILKPGILVRHHGRWENGKIWQIAHASTEEYCCCDHCYPAPEPASTCRWRNQHPPEWVFPAVSFYYVDPDFDLSRGFRPGSVRSGRGDVAGISHFWVAVDGEIVHLYWPATWLEIVGDKQPVLQQGLFEGTA